METKEKKRRLLRDSAICLVLFIVCVPTVFLIDIPRLRILEYLIKAVLLVLLSLAVPIMFTGWEETKKRENRPMILGLMGIWFVIGLMIGLIEAICLAIRY